MGGYWSPGHRSRGDVATLQACADICTTDGATCIAFNWASGYKDSKCYTYMEIPDGALVTDSNVNPAYTKTSSDASRQTISTAKLDQWLSSQNAKLKGRHL